MKIMKLVLPLLLVFCGLNAQAAQTELTWFGHAAFKITTPTGKVLLIDPWILAPHNKNAVADYKALTRVDYILLSHGHHNHIGDALEIAKKTGAKLIASSTVATSLIKNIKFPKAQTLQNIRMDTWSTIELEDGIKVTLAPAKHMASNEHEKDAKMRNNAAYAGAYGLIVEIKDGPTLYHTGDTSLINDLGTIATKFKIDVMMVCIGDKFTMGPADAADAVQLVKPAMVIPMHFGSVEGMTGTPDVLAQELKAVSSPAILRQMKIGETITF